MRKVAFEALIYEVRTRSLRSGDKSVRIVLEVDSPSEKLLEGVNRLHRADRLIGVALADGES